MPPIPKKLGSASFIGQGLARPSTSQALVPTPAFSALASRTAGLHTSTGPRTTLSTQTAGNFNNIKSPPSVARGVTTTGNRLSLPSQRRSLGTAKGSYKPFSGAVNVAEYTDPKTLSAILESASKHPSAFPTITTPPTNNALLKQASLAFQENNPELSALLAAREVTRQAI
jgi:hypothetical protein